MRRELAPRRTPALGAALVVGILLAATAYGLFEARRLIEGPQVSIETPQDGSATSSAATLITGTARNISFLTLNDRQILTDEKGHFAELVTAPPGYTVFTVLGKDRFGRSALQEVHITILNFCPIG